MGKKKFLASVVLALIVLLTGGTQLIEVVSANFVPPPPTLPPIYIKADGTIEPSNASIQCVGDTYTFTQNITGYCLWLQKSNIIIDGAGYALQGLPNRTAYIMYGIVMEGRTNVTIKNIIFTGLNIGVNIDNPSGNTPSFNNTITNNTFQNCLTSVSLGYQSYNNTISRNTFTDNDPYCIFLFYANGNSILENNITNNHSSSPVFVANPEVHVFGCGAIAFQTASNNTIVRNNFQNNTRIVELIGDSQGNLFCQNDFIDSSVILMLPYPPPFNSNRWDNGSMGNYWSDYLTKYPNSTEIGSTGIGNSQYVIDSNNTDNYPLMSAVNISPIASSPTLTPSPSAPQIAPSSSPVPPSPSVPEIPAASIIIAAIVAAFAVIIIKAGLSQKKRQTSTLALPTQRSLRK